MPLRFIIKTLQFFAEAESALKTDEEIAVNSIKTPLSVAGWLQSR